LHDNSLVATNGISALISNHSQRTAFIQAVWDLEIVRGDARYYANLLRLLALLTLSGQYRIY
jgi:hypothetical protein